MIFAPNSLFLYSQCIIITDADFSLVNRTFHSIRIILSDFTTGFSPSRPTPVFPNQYHSTNASHLLFIHSFYIVIHFSIPIDSVVK